VNLERTLFGSGSTAKSTLAGLLAVLLIVAATVSVTHSLHQYSRTASDASHHACLFCALAKGQVSASDLGPVAAIVILAWFSGFRPASAAPLAQFDYRLSPSRAPPGA